LGNLHRSERPFYALANTSEEKKLQPLLPIVEETHYGVSISTARLRKEQAQSALVVTSDHALLNAAS